MCLEIFLTQIFVPFWNRLSFFSGGDFEHRIWTIIVPWFLVGVTSILSTHEWMGLHILIFFHKSGKIFWKRSTICHTIIFRSFLSSNNSLDDPTFNQLPFVFEFPKNWKFRGDKNFFSSALFFVDPFTPFLIWNRK